MSTVRNSVSIAALMALLTLASPATAQEERFRVSFAPSVGTVEGDAALALSGTAGYRFSEHFWFEGDITWLDSSGLGDRDYDIPIPYLTSVNETIRRTGGTFLGGVIGIPLPPTFPIVPFPPTRVSVTLDGSTLIATVGVRYELPRQTVRFRPYLSGGLGINHTDQEMRIEPLGIDASASRTGFAFNGGAGASVLVWRQLWADVDAKYFRLSGDRDIMRLGGGVSVRF